MLFAKLSVIEGDPIYMLVQGKPYFHHDVAIRLMLEAKAICVRNSECTDDAMLYAAVDTSDLFAWGYSDWYKLQLGHIEPLYHEWRKNPKRGPTIWVLKQYNRQPQPPYKQLLIKEGAWTPELEALDANEDGTFPENYVCNE
jgi:hypothetical protein